MEKHTARQIHDWRWDIYVPEQKVNILIQTLPKDQCSAISLHVPIFLQNLSLLMLAVTILAVSTLVLHQTIEGLLNG